MAEGQKQNNNNERPLGVNGEYHLHGRINNTDNPEFEKLPTQNDISEVDQQEGNMNHGEEGPDLGNGSK